MVVVEDTVGMLVEDIEVVVEGIEVAVEGTLGMLVEGIEVDPFDTFGMDRFGGLVVGVSVLRFGVVGAGWDWGI